MKTEKRKAAMRKHLDKLDLKHDGGGGYMNVLVNDVDARGLQRPILPNLPHILALESKSRARDARVVGKGTYGTCWAVRMDAALALQLEGMRADGLHRVLGTMPGAGSMILVKIQESPRGAHVNEYFVTDCVREATLHRQLSSGKRGSSTCAELGGLPVCPSAVVPRFHCAALIAYRTDESKGVKSVAAYVTIMEFVRGTTLSAYIKAHKNTINVGIYAAVEAAIATLWAAGIVHADFHESNVLVCDDSTVRIIDFGFSLKLPAAMAASLRARMRAAISAEADTLAGTWRDESARKTGDGETLRKWVVSTTTRRLGLKPNRENDMNEDARMLMRMFLAIPPSKWKDVPMARASAFLGLAATLAAALRLTNAAKAKIVRDFRKRNDDILPKTPSPVRSKKRGFLRRLFLQSQ